MAFLGQLGIENQSGVQSDGKFCNPVAPSAVRVVISNTEVVDIKDNKGRNLLVCFTILDHSSDVTVIGQDIGGYYALWANDPVTAKIGIEKFSKLCHCLGMGSIQNSEDLHGQELILILDKDPKSTQNFTNIYRFLTPNGLILSSNNGDLQPYDGKHAEHLAELLARVNGQAVNPAQLQQQAPATFTPQNGQVPQGTFPPNNVPQQVAPVQQQPNFAPQNNGGAPWAQQQNPQNGVAPAQAQSNFTPHFAGNPQ